MGVERQLLAYIAKKYQQPLHKALHRPYFIPNESIQLRIKNEKKLIQVLSYVPQWGIGRIVTTMKDEDKPATFWRITRVHVDYTTDNFFYGLVWGVFTNKGKCNFFEEEIKEADLHMWRLVPKYEEDKYLNYKPESEPFNEIPLHVSLSPLLSRMYKIQKSKELNKSFEKEPMVRLLIDRGPTINTRQKINDGTLV